MLTRGLAANTGTVDDAIGIRGVRFGPSGGVQLGEALPLTLRFGAGVFVAQAVDTRRGTFTTSARVPYGVDVAESVPATYLYLAPEARVDGVATFDDAATAGSFMLNVVPGVDLRYLF